MCKLYTAIKLIYQLLKTTAYVSLTHTDLLTEGYQDCLKTVIEENPVMKDDAFIAQANAECSSAFYFGMAHTHLPEPHVLQKPYL